MKTMREARSKMKKTGAILAMTILGAVLLALASPAAFGQKASDPPFKVKIDFDRWHDVPELYADFQKLQNAFPQVPQVPVHRQVLRTPGPHGPDDQ